MAKSDKQRAKEYRVKNRVLANKRSAECVRKRRYKELYGITIDEYNRLFAEQIGCCKMCGKYQSEIEKKLFVDHNHITGKVRGLLCCNCNFIIGHAFDDIEILKNAIAYLQC